MTEHSGQFRLRLPTGLHAELAAEAERQGVSLNALISALLAGAVGWRKPDSRLAQARRGGGPTDLAQGQRRDEPLTQQERQTPAVK